MSGSARKFLWLLCCLLLALRVSGMHVHLGDAHEDAPLGMHVPNVGLDHELHHEHEHAHDQDEALHTHSGHVSVDIGLENQALGKKASYDAGSWLMAAVLLCLLLAPRELRLAQPRHALPPLTHPPHLRPPLRGPPACA